MWKLETENEEKEGKQNENNNAIPSHFYSNYTFDLFILFYFKKNDLSSFQFRFSSANHIKSVAFCIILISLINIEEKEMFELLRAGYFAKKFKV